MNVLLVGILKQDWPHRWRSFIPDIVGASKTSEVLCENNVTILRLLSEEVFDFSKDSMTSERAAALKAGLQTELQQIFELLLFVLEASSRRPLIIAALECLQRYVTWIPERYLFETAMLEVLCMKFLPLPEFRVPCLQVLCEVAALIKPEYNKVFELLYIGVMGQIVRTLTVDGVKPTFAAAEASGDEASMLYLRHLALFLTTFLAEHGTLLEVEVYKEAMRSGLEYLVQASDVGDAEIFKICVEFWLRCASSLYETEAQYNPALPSLAAVVAAGGGGEAAAGGAGAPQSVQQPTSMEAVRSGPNPRKPYYAEVLSRVREVMIRHMARPEEVLIEKDDSGEYVREQQKDTDAIALYKIMRDTMVFLTHLDPRNTEELMLEKLAKQVNGEEWGYDVLNTLCWAIGSISGTMGELEEKNFLVTVIRDLLLLCETKRGKSNKAVIASNIMCVQWGQPQLRLAPPPPVSFHVTELVLDSTCLCPPPLPCRLSHRYVVGQYPRFLRAHWKFLRTVVIKLFEFMHERHPGVQDMAVDTFLKIAQKTRKRFVQVQASETRPFIEALCEQLPTIVSDLEPHQVHTFYEAAGHMVSAYPTEAQREACAERLMAVPAAAWRRLIAASAESGLETLKDPAALREMHRVLRTHVFACRSVGSSFAKQVGALFVDMMGVYRALSGFVGAALAAHGPAVLATHTLKCMINVKKEVLALVATYVSVAESPAFVAEHFIPPLLEPVLGEYAAAQPAAREVEVLTLMAEVVAKLRGDVLAHAPRILATVFEPTLSMVAAAPAADEFPEHRLAFFKLLEAINAHCFAALAAIPPDQLAAVVAAVCWAFKHMSRETGETGLAILESLLANIVSSSPDSLAQPFLQRHLLDLVVELLGVLTDRLHKAHLRQHSELLRFIFAMLNGRAVKAPLWLAPAAAAPTAVAQKFAATISQMGAAAPSLEDCNREFAKQYVTAWLKATQANLQPAQIAAFVDGLFNTSDPSLYKTHLRDFLIEVLVSRHDARPCARLLSLLASALLVYQPIAIAAPPSPPPPGNLQEFKSQDASGDLYAEERARKAREEEARRLVVPGLANPYSVLPESYKTVDDDL